MMMMVMVMTKVIRMMTVMITIIVASFALPMLPKPTIEMYILRKKKYDDHNDYDQGDDDDHEDETYHRSIICMTNAADDHALPMLPQKRS